MTNGRVLWSAISPGRFSWRSKWAVISSPGKRTGSIVNIASTHGLVALAQRSTNGISKGAVIHMTRVLAYEWAEHGIRVNAIAPGLGWTPSRAEYFSARPDQRAMMEQRGAARPLLLGGRGCRHRRLSAGQGRRVRHGSDDRARWRSDDVLMDAQPRVRPPRRRADAPPRDERKAVRAEERESLEARTTRSSGAEHGSGLQLKNCLDFSLRSPAAAPQRRPPCVHAGPVLLNTSTIRSDAPLMTLGVLQKVWCAVHETAYAHAALDAIQITTACDLQLCQQIRRAQSRRGLSDIHRKLASDFADLYFILPASRAT